MGAKQMSLDHFPGKLFVVEGIDGSGKSTQLDLLHKWLRAQNYLVVFTEWNSSPIVRRTTRRAKRARMLTPLSFSLIHAADFASRIHSVVLPALRAGAVVLADRYVYTAFARDRARGVDRAWLREVYDFAPTPTVPFYFDVPLDEAIRRITLSRAEVKYYEAGMDLRLSDDILESFRLFQGLILKEYHRLVPEYDLQLVDATQPLVRQQDQVRQLVEPHLADVPRVPRGELNHLLQAAGLTGRYLRTPRWMLGESS